MQNSYSKLWRELHRKTLWESEEEKLKELVQATELAILLRLQELESSADSHEERTELENAAADLLAIKTHKLGWPQVPVPSRGGLH
jgi:hypothetical protein